ncbi:hypothetical protein [Clostridium sp. DJ247]|uniref:hypothetical protein n=1 Tax=Clostridium sp. DJ247 TaxID=2726188 RepID=UPI0016232371|nr:hypothetical protein [Clostridium sp. DJ247]MBC2582894.1 hypothetical protein [Clostridium sp. DJ247]
MKGKFGIPMKQSLAMNLEHNIKPSTGGRHARTFTFKISPISRKRDNEIYNALKTKRCISI